jgi:hypothetical protein
VATQSPQQTITIDGSSFESASSFHSLARVDAICEDLPLLPPPTIDEKAQKSSPAHSVSSSSSGSYRMPPSMKLVSPSKLKTLSTSIKKGVVGSSGAISNNNNNNSSSNILKKKSVSDDERSEKFHSSSHDEKNHHKTSTLRVRKSKDWCEDERRRKKGNFKLDVEKEGKISSGTSSAFVRPSGVLKKISPDDKTALNLLDGTSPSKQKPRFRGKTRKTPRTRTPVVIDDANTARRLSKTSIASKSPEKPLTASAAIVPIQQQPQKPTASSSSVAVVPSTKISPLKFTKTCMLSSSSPSKHQHALKKTSGTAQRLKAISTESLRSVSPGSDSVFYSEADIMEHQIHCHHCGKEVEVVTAVGGGSEESVVIVDDGPDIVQPPEGFADSPNGINNNNKIPPALKYYKRYRSEDRRHKKGANGRAKVKYSFILSFCI